MNPKGQEGSTGPENTRMVPPSSPTQKPSPKRHELSWQGPGPRPSHLRDPLGGLQGCLTGLPLKQLREENKPLLTQGQWQDPLSPPLPPGNPRGLRKQQGEGRCGAVPKVWLKLGQRRPWVTVAAQPSTAGGPQTRPMTQPFQTPPVNWVDDLSPEGLLSLSRALESYSNRGTGLGVDREV